MCLTRDDTGKVERHVTKINDRREMGEFVNFPKKIETLIPLQPPIIACCFCISFCFIRIRLYLETRLDMFDFTMMYGQL